jgi:hypothetical protein
MTQLQQIVHIADDRRLRLDLSVPEDVPTGHVEMRVFFSPVTPVSAQAPARDGETSLADCSAFGMWAGREDMENPGEWVKNLRNSTRYDY